MSDASQKRAGVILEPGAGRPYSMGRIARWFAEHPPGDAPTPEESPGP